MRLGGQLDMHYVSPSPDGVYEDFLVRRAWVVLNASYSDFLSASFVTDIAATARILDANVTLAFDPAFQLTFGRFKRSFDLYVLASIADIMFLERAGTIPGYSACTGVGSVCTFGRLSEGLLFANRDTGLRAAGSLGSVHYEVSLTNGTRHGVADDNSGKSTAARVSWQVDDDLVMGLNATQKDYLGPGLPADIRYATAWGPDVQFGTWRDGPLVQVAYLGGDNWQSLSGPDDEPGRFSTAQVQSSWYVPTDGARVEGIEPMLRVSVADPDDNVEDDGGVLLTPGFAAYFQGRNRISLNLDYYDPASGDPVWALRVGTLLFF